MSSQQGWYQVLRPWLESKIRNSWPDPQEFKDTEEFVYGYTKMWGFAKAANEILEFVDSMQEQMDKLQKKERGELKSKFDIGRV